VKQLSPAYRPHQGAQAWRTRKMGATNSWLNSANQRSMCASSVRNTHDQNKEADLDSRRVLEELDEEGDVLESLLGIETRKNPKPVVLSK